MELENYKEVDFRKYCKRCEHRNVSEDNDPCYDCLQEPAILYSKVPLNYKERRGIKKDGKSRVK